MVKSLVIVAMVALLYMVVHPNYSIMAQPCATNILIGGTHTEFQSCHSLTVQGAALAWNLDTSNSSIDIIFTGTMLSYSGWVGWGINPTHPSHMGGTQAFIAFANASGAHLLTYDVTEGDKVNGISPGPINLSVLSKKVEISGGNVAIYVKLQLGPNMNTTLNHVWNRGDSVIGDIPTPHNFNNDGLTSFSTIDMSTIKGSRRSVQEEEEGGGGDEASEEKLKINHGIINTVAWGILFPLGIMAARYLRPISDPLWFYLHIAFQVSGYIIGVAGWATGMKLGGESGEDVSKHKAIGITLFTISTLQVSALLVRPNKDHKIRKYWNIYHHTVGYAIITLGIINIFEGFELLEANKKWLYAYIGVIGVLGGVSLILEILTWALFASKKKTSSNNVKKSSNVQGSGPTPSV